MTTTQLPKSEVVTKAISALQNSGRYNQPEVREEKRVALEHLRQLQGDLDSLAIESITGPALLALSHKLTSIGATEEAKTVENMAFLIFTDGDPEPWFTKEPEREPNSPPKPDTATTDTENDACLAEEVKCDLNCGEMPTIVLSRTAINVLCVTKRNHPDKKYDLPIAWHQPITGKAVIEVVGIQMDGVQIPMETRVIFKGKRCKVQAFRTGLGGSVHGLCIEAIDTDNGRFNSWDLYTDVPTDKGKKTGIGEAPKPCW